MNACHGMLKSLNIKTSGAMWRRASGIQWRKASLFESLRRACLPLCQSGLIHTAKGSNWAFRERWMCHIWRSRKSGGCENKVGQEQVGSEADVSWAEDELHVNTQSHRCLLTAWSRKGEREENRNNIKLKGILTKSSAGPIQLTHFKQTADSVEQMKLRLCLCLKGKEKNPTFARSKSGLVHNYSIWNIKVFSFL